LGGRKTKKTKKRGQEGEISPEEREKKNRLYAHRKGGLYYASFEEKGPRRERNGALQEKHLRR